MKALKAFLENIQELYHCILKTISNKGNTQEFQIQLFF